MSVIGDRGGIKRNFNGLLLLPNSEQRFTERMIQLYQIILSSNAIVLFFFFFFLFFFFSNSKLKLRFYNQDLFGLIGKKLFNKRVNAVIDRILSCCT